MLYIVEYMVEGLSPDLFKDIPLTTWGI